MGRYTVWIPFLLLAACGGPEPGAGGFTFDAPLRVEADGPVYGGALRFTVAGGVGTRTGEVVVPLDHLAVRIDKRADRVMLERLEVPIGDLDVPAQALPPDGLPLRDMELAMKPPVVATVVRVDPDFLALSVRLPLRLTWETVLLDGTPWSLGPVDTDPIDVSLTVTAGPDGTTARVEAACGATCWELPGVVAVRDVSLAAETRAHVTAR
jgi:hypothetical protein